MSFPEWLPIAMALAAALYTSVGHGGASAYIALMALAGLLPDETRTMALVLNVAAAGVATVRFARAGQSDFALVAPLALASVPAAFFAAQVPLSAAVFKPLLAAALLAAGFRYLVWPDLDAERPRAAPSTPLLVVIGAGLGALAGLTGIGGGVYLSPLLIFTGWARPKRAAGVAAPFILVNSLAGLAGRLDGVAGLPPLDFGVLLGVVIVGAAVGTSLSLKAFTQKLMLRALGVGLGVAALAVVR